MQFSNSFSLLCAPSNSSSLTAPYRPLPRLLNVPFYTSNSVNPLLRIGEGGCGVGHWEHRNGSWKLSANRELQVSAPEWGDAWAHQTRLSDSLLDRKTAYAAYPPRSPSPETNGPKGSMFVSKLREILEDLKQKGLKRSNVVKENYRVQLSSSPKGDSYASKLKDAETNSEAEILSVNLFANAPPIPWEADNMYAASKLWLPKKVSFRRNQKRSNYNVYVGKGRALVDANSNPVCNDINYEKHGLQRPKESYVKALANRDASDDCITSWERKIINVDSDERSTVPCASDNAVKNCNNTKPKWQQHTIDKLHFEFKYSYSETPNVPILGYRERPYSPFGPTSIQRPWTGRKPPRPSKGEVPEFDSFNPPPSNKKGVKFVQDPGPYPKGQGPQPARSREEVLGEPLSKEDIVHMVEKCDRENRQINLGRDGLTHNMLDTIHCHWKRRRVCKIKCKGVPTVDMANVCFHLEDKTGGRIIYNTGGVVYLFRGRNYNYKDRPTIPLMLWKPATPIYPKLIEDAPAGLTKEMANKLRILGQKVEPIYRIGKNGVYLTLVEDVRNAFQLDALVRIDCRGLNPSDYKRIGGKLKDLVPCVLLSFEKEHILMWKGNSCTVETKLNNFSNHDLMPERELSNLKDGRNTPLEKFQKCDADDNHEENIKKHVNEQQHHKDVQGNKIIKDEHTEVCVDALWEHAIASGMAIELDEFDMDNELIVTKINELFKTAPAGPRYTHKLLKRLQIKRSRKEKRNELHIYFSRSRYIDKPNKQVKKRTYQLPTVDVPLMGGLPVDELAKLLAV